MISKGLIRQNVMFWQERGIPPEMQVRWLSSKVGLTDAECAKLRIEALAMPRPSKFWCFHDYRRCGIGDAECCKCGNVIDAGESNICLRGILQFMAAALLSVLLVGVPGIALLWLFGWLVGK